MAAKCHRYRLQSDSPSAKTLYHRHIMVLSLSFCKVIDTVMSSPQEAETASGFITARELAPLRMTLQELGHPQGPTPLQFDNKCATGIINDNVKQKMFKAMDMRFYWLRDRVQQGQFHVYWKRGILNLGDYVTKHHPTKHHQAVCPTYYVCNNVQLPPTSQDITLKNIIKSYAQPTRTLYAHELPNQNLTPLR